MKILSHSLNQRLSTWWEGRASPAELRCVQCPLSDWKGWSQDPPHPTPHLRVGNGSKGILLGIPAYVRPSKGKQKFFLHFCIYSCCIWACSHWLQPRTLPPCRYSCVFCHVIALQILCPRYCQQQRWLQWYSSLFICALAQSMGCLKASAEKWQKNSTFVVVD